VSAPKTVAVLVGSFRKESFTRKVAHALTELAPATLKLEFVDIGQLPLYNPDLESPAPPPAWQAFRDRIRTAAAVLFATPEYNRSVPGGLKNAIDVGSRPPKQSVWSGKPAAILSVSPGNLGAFGANHHLRQSLVFLDMPTMQQPEAYLGGVDKLLDADGKLINPSTKEFLTKFVTAFATWIDRLTDAKA
jgi:chromate reductase